MAKLQKGKQFNECESTIRKRYLQTKFEGRKAFTDKIFKQNIDKLFTWISVRVLQPFGNLIQCQNR